MAIKFLPPEMTRDEEAKRRFQQEAEAAAALDHPNICTIYEVGETEEGHLFIAMACYAGETLKARLEKGPLPAAEAAWIAAQAAAGLAHAHGKGIVHRDVKPANLMLLPDGGVKVLDFGLAKVLGQTTRTKDGSTMGTVAYMSPEQAGGAKVDARTDVWSLGAVLYEMVTGRVPFEGDYSQAVIYGILNHDPVAPSKVKPGVPPELERVILLCLAKEPGERIQTMAELAAELGEAGVTGPVTPGRKTRRSGRWPRQMRSWLARQPFFAFLTVLLIIGIAGMAYWWWRNQETSPTTPVGPERLMLAVLPFENLGSPNNEYVADGVTEQLISRLSQLHSLGVIARTSVEEYKKTKKKIQQIAEELGVDYILEGTIRWDPNTSERGYFRVTAQLIRIADGAHLWSEDYDAGMGDLLKTQAEIAEKVASSLQVRLVESERKGLAAVSTRNAEAYGYLLEGKTAKNLDEAMGFYLKAIAIDPAFVEAQAAVAETHLNKYNSGEDHSENRWSLATAAIERAGSIDPDHPDVHFMLGRWYALKSEHGLVEDEYRQALQRRPGDPAILFQLAMALLSQGKWSECLRIRERNAGLNPRVPLVLVSLANRYLSSQRYAEAERYYRRAMALDPEGRRQDSHFEWVRIFIMRDCDPVKAVEYLDNLPPKLQRQYQIQYRYDYLDYLWMAGQNDRILKLLSTYPEVLGEVNHLIILNSAFRGAVLRTMGRLDEARAAYTEALHQVEMRLKEKPEQASYISARGQIFAALGRKEEAIWDSRRALAMWPPGQIPYLRQVKILAGVYTMVGEYDLAFDQLEILLRNPWTTNINTVKCRPTFRPLLSHPRFQALAKKFPPDRPYSGE